MAHCLGGERAAYSPGGAEAFLLESRRHYVLPKQQTNVLCCAMFRYAYHRLGSSKLSQRATVIVWKIQPTGTPAPGSCPKYRHYHHADIMFHGNNIHSTRIDSTEWSSRSNKGWAAPFILHQDIVSGARVLERWLKRTERSSTTGRIEPSPTRPRLKKKAW